MVFTRKRVPPFFSLATPAPSFFKSQDGTFSCIRPKSFIYKPKPFAFNTEIIQHCIRCTHYFSGFVFARFFRDFIIIIEVIKVKKAIRAAPITAQRI